MDGAVDDESAAPWLPAHAQMGAAAAVPRDRSPGNSPGCVRTMRHGDATTGLARGRRFMAGAESPATKRGVMRLAGAGSVCRSNSTCSSVSKTTRLFGPIRDRVSRFNLDLMDLMDLMAFTEALLSAESASDGGIARYRVAGAVVYQY